MSKSKKSLQSAPYKRAEFKAFISTIKSGQVGHWVEVAEALGVDKTTITEWKKIPEAQEAIKQGIDHALAQMELAGRKDWRMWEAKLKMLVGKNQETTLVNPLILILEKYGGGKGMGISDVPTVHKITARSSEDPA